MWAEVVELGTERNTPARQVLCSELSFEDCVALNVLTYTEIRA